MNMPRKRNPQFGDKVTVLAVYGAQATVGGVRVGQPASHVVFRSGDGSIAYGEVVDTDISLVDEQHSDEPLNGVELVDTYERVRRAAKLQSLQLVWGDPNWGGHQEDWVEAALDRSLRAYGEGARADEATIKYHQEQATAHLAEIQQLTQEKADLRTANAMSDETVAELKRQVDERDEKLRIQKEVVNRQGDHIVELTAELDAARKPVTPDPYTPGPKLTPRMVRDNPQA